MSVCLCVRVLCVCHVSCVGSETIENMSYVVSTQLQIAIKGLHIQPALFSNCLFLSVCVCQYAHL